MPQNNHRATTVVIFFNAIHILYCCVEWTSRADKHAHLLTAEITSAGTQAQRMPYAVLTQQQGGDVLPSK